MTLQETDFNRILDIMKRGERFLVTTHEAPDGDAIGSSLALYWTFRILHKECYLFCKDAVPQHFLFLEGSRRFHSVPPDYPVDAIFALDYGSLRRLGIDEYRSRFPAIPFITIDHHLKRDQEGEICVIDTDVSSCAEIVYRLLTHGGVPLSRSCAQALLTGIFTDSGGFRHVCTSPKTLEAVSALVRKGCSTSHIARNTFRYSPETLPAFGKIFSRVTLDPEVRMVSSWISYDDIAELDLDPSKIEGAATLIGSADTSRFSVFLIEKRPRFVEASLRSEPFKGFEVNKIAEHFGGGGHRYAAGFRAEGHIEEVLSRIKQIAIRYV